MSRTQTVDPSISRTPIPLDATNAATVCVLCSHNCGLRVDVKDGEIVDVRADESNPITEGYVCNKAFSIQHYVKHAQRVQHPLRRKADGTFERVDWDTAIREIAAKLKTVREQHTPRAIALVGVGGQANHMDAPWALGFLRALGSKRWFNAFAQEKTQHSLLDQWMFDASPATFMHPDADHTQCMLVMGTNPKISNRGHNATDTFKKFTDDPARKLIVIDPRETETTRGATRHLRVRPGGDAYLLLALAATIVQRDLVDATFVAQHTTDFDALRTALAGVDVAAMAERCGLTVDEITATATDFATAEGASIFYDLGVEQTRFSTLISWLIRVLVAITGNVGNHGGQVFIESFLPPVVDPSRVTEPERALASGIPAIRALGNAGMFSPTLVPEEILIDHPERIRAVIVEGSNPLLSFSDAPRWREAREKLDLLVVIEPAMTETAMLADYVLPTPVGYEKWEIANFPKRHPEVHVQLRPPVVPGPSDALPEPEIYVRLAEALELFGPPPAELFPLAAEAHTVDGAGAYLMTLQTLASGNESRVMFWAYRTLGPHLPAPTLAAVWLLCGINAMFRRDGILRTFGDAFASASPIEIALEMFNRILAHPEGVEIAKAGDGFVSGFADGRIRLVPEAIVPEIGRALAAPPAADPDYPFVMAAGLRTRWTANTIQRDPAWRKGRGPHCTLNLSPADAKKLGLATGDAVRVATPRGELTLPAQVDAKLLDGHVWMPNGFGHVWGEAPVGGNQNELTDVADRDPFTGIPHHRYVPVQLTRA